MTRKDYIILAEVFSSYPRHLNTYGRPTIGEVVRQELAEKMADTLAKQSTKFDKELFLRNAGVKQ